MSIFKKVFGSILLAFAALLSLSIFLALLKGILESIVEIQKTGSVGIAYAFGSLFAIAIFAVITFFIAKLGLKLIRGKQEQTSSSIEDIGQ